MELMEGKNVKPTSHEAVQMPCNPGTPERLLQKVKSDPREQSLRINLTSNVLSCNNRYLKRRIFYVFKGSCHIYGGKNTTYMLIRLGIDLFDKFTAWNPIRQLIENVIQIFVIN
jgi:hypothetical protein